MSWVVEYDLDSREVFDTSEQAVHYAVWNLATRGISYSISEV